MRASYVCVHNAAAFVLHWHLSDEHSGARSAETASYPVGETECVSAALPGNVTAVVPHVRAVLGESWSAAEGVAYDPSAGGVTY
eukprot:gene28342-62056_t